MTPQGQIARLRDFFTPDDDPTTTIEESDDAAAILAVCDLAERALLTDDEAEAVRRWLAQNASREWGDDTAKVEAVLRRLLPEERVEQRLDPRTVSLAAGYRLTVNGPEAFFDYLHLTLHDDGTVTWFSDKPDAAPAGIYRQDGSDAYGP